MRSAHCWKQAMERKTFSEAVRAVKAYAAGKNGITSCLPLVATTMRSDNQNFYEERMEVSRRNWNRRGSAARLPEAAASNKPKSLTINYCRRGAVARRRDANSSQLPSYPGITKVEIIA